MNLKNKYSLVDVARPEKGNYLMLESINYEKNTARIIHIIMPSETKKIFKLGRGHESDVRITDISVSRFHASINFSKEGFYIEDNVSKFGTLALATTVEINPLIKKAIQVGRTVISFNVKQPELEA